MKKYPKKKKADTDRELALAIYKEETKRTNRTRSTGLPTGYYSEPNIREAESERKSSTVREFGLSGVLDNRESPPNATVFIQGNILQYKM